MAIRICLPGCSGHTAPNPKEDRMKDMAKVVFLAMVGFALAACTGTTVDVEMEPPTKEEKARADYARIVDEANFQFHSDYIGYHEGESTPDRTHVECVRRLCAIGYTFLITENVYSVEQVTLEVQQGLNGMRKVIERIDGGEYADVQVVGGWMEHSFFASEVAKFTNELYPETGSIRLISYAVGNTTGTNPTVPEGGATWQGFMAGRDISTTDSLEAYIEGEARIVVDLGSANGLLADVALTRLYNRHTGQVHSDLRWSNLDVEKGGFSDRKAEDDRINGQFFGPAQEEVAGTFERSGITGAFGGEATD